MTDAATTVQAISPLDPALRALMEAQQTELAARDGEDHNTEPFDPASLDTPRAAVLGVWLDGELVGCGAVRELAAHINPNTAEVKRMYVVPHARRRGLARLMLAELEARARGLGFERAWLETGTRLHEANGLYEASGYHQIPRYGYYADNPFSVCFEKLLSGHVALTAGP